jgi:hypothetical protein
LQPSQRKLLPVSPNTRGCSLWALWMISFGIVVYPRMDVFR